jgi:hypothetical protein
MRPAEKSGERTQKTAVSKEASVPARSIGAGTKAGADASRAGAALVRAIGRLANRAIDEILLEMGAGRDLRAEDGETRQSGARRRSA